MKKLTILFALIIAVATVQAQKSKVVSAYNYLGNGQLDKAKKAIDEASVHESSKGLAKTWLYKGNIYLQISVTDNEDYKALSDDPLTVAYESYNKCIELDQKGRYSGEAKVQLDFVASRYFNEGVTKYKEKEYPGAIKSFKMASQLYKGSAHADTSFYFAGICAELDNNDTEAKEIFGVLNEKGFEKPLIYNSLSKIYTKEKDEAKAIEIIKKGLEIFPGDLDLIIAEANVYLAFDKNKEAIESLKKAIEKNPNNPNLFYVIGAKYSSLNMFEESEKSYLKAIELNDKYFDAYYNLGALYNNTAADVLKEAGNLPFGDEKYDEMKAKGEDMLKKAIPVLEKALEIDPKDKYTLLTLKQLYAKTQAMDKFREVSAKITEYGYE